jgi:hypothetical protein
VSRVTVRHVCGHDVEYEHGLGAFIIERWKEQAETEPCRRCLALGNLDMLMKRCPEGAVQLALF